MFPQTDWIPLAFVAAALCGLGGGLYAFSRGRNALLWGLVSSVLLIPALICLAVLPRLSPEASAADGGDPSPGRLYHRSGVLVLMVALFAFALMIALGSINDGEYWPVLRGAMVLAAMAMFLGFWGIMLGWRKWKLASKPNPE